MIRLENVCKTYNVGGEDVRALNRVTLSIDAGQYLSVMGPSGSGKSTLLNVLGLLDRPDSGEYWLAGQSTASLDEAARAQMRRQHIGFVFQSFHLIPRLSAVENVELPLMLAGVPPKERRRLSQTVLEQVGLAERQRHLPRQLSGGQLQRVAIARAIITKPQLLLADEPTGNLDQHSGREVVKVLESLNDEGITLLVVTHDLELGRRARRQLRMVDGQVVKDIVNDAA